MGSKNNLPLPCSDDYLRDYTVENGKLTLSIHSSTEFANPGATPSVSANGNNNAIVWAVASKTWNGPDQPAVLYAFDANSIDHPIYTSEQNSRRDRAAMATRFVIPVVVNGRVYFGARGEVEVYGLLNSDEKKAEPINSRMLDQAVADASRVRFGRGVLIIALFCQVERKLILICWMISSKFRTEDRAKTIGPAGVCIPAADHACERPRQNKAAGRQRFDRHGIRLDAVHDESVSG